MSATADTPILLKELQKRPGSADAIVALPRFERYSAAMEMMGDFAAATVGVIAAYSIYHLLKLGREIVYPTKTLLCGALGFAFLYVLMLDREGAYRSGHGLLFVRETERTLRVSSQAFLLLLAVSILASQLISRWVLGIVLFLVPIVVVIQKQLFRAFVSFLHTRGRGIRKVVIYGAGATGKRMLSAIVRSPNLGLNPVAIVDDNRAEVGKDVYAFDYHRRSCVPVISGPLTPQLLKSYGTALVVVAIPSLGRHKFTAVAEAAAEAGARLAFVPTQAIASDAWLDYVDLDGQLLATVTTPTSKSLYRTSKRVCDIIAGVALLILASPILTFVALAVRIESEGPVIFAQRRVGRNGELFVLYKFRSMQVDAPRYGFSPTDAKDARITRVGRFLRKTSLDELPQLWNVVKGDMSLVGPRPEMPFIVEQYGPRERQRLSVVPGITGLWQLSADRAFLIHENLEYDLYYIRNRGLFMDLAILLHTALFAMKGV
ncbi:MAG: sugar transferase [Candidatus Korobacteraceae bacterium]